MSEGPKFIIISIYSTIHLLKEKSRVKGQQSQKLHYFVKYNLILKYLYPFFFFAHWNSTVSIVKSCTPKVSRYLGEMMDKRFCAHQHMSEIKYHFPNTLCSGQGHGDAGAKPATIGWRQDTPWTVTSIIYSHKLTYEARFLDYGRNPERHANSTQKETSWDSNQGCLSVRRECSPLHHRATPPKILQIESSSKHF